jgi:hypothetical protein
VPILKAEIISFEKQPDDYGIEKQPDEFTGPIKKKGVTVQEIVEAGQNQDKGPPREEVEESMEGLNP